ncbi:MAG: hypothetical protein GXX95_00660 [Methanomassiliicoccus sp.]|jgi:hypothetical protein|nr:hypothetical protein [Methanomassiliicoccus sp.]
MTEDDSSAITERSKHHQTLTLEELALAIKRTIDEHDMPNEVAQELAHRILNFFGHGERVVDNMLEPVDRDAFYMLEDAGILTTEMEQITLYDGREWRIHYWLFRKERIRELIENKAAADEDTDKESVYDSLTEDVWKHTRQ